MINYIKKLKQGCGKEYSVFHPKICGAEGTEKRLICEDCQAELKGAKNILDELEKKIKEIRTPVTSPHWEPLNQMKERVLEIIANAKGEIEDSTKSQEVNNG